MSIIITENQIEYLKDFISNLDELLMAGEVNDLLIAIDDAIIETFDEDGYPDETGNQRQRIYQGFDVFVPDCRPGEIRQTFSVDERK